MKIFWNKIKGVELESKLRALSTAFVIKRNFHQLYGDRECEFDLYLHIFDAAYAEMKEFVDANGLIEYIENIDDVPMALGVIAERYALDPNISNPMSQEDHICREWMSIIQSFGTLSRLIGTLTYHTHRMKESPDDREVEIRNVYHTWLLLKKHNRDAGLLKGFSDDELRDTVIEWFIHTQLPKQPDLFEKVDALQGRRVDIVAGKYTGPRPNIPASEMAEGYDFGLSI